MIVDDERHDLPKGTGQLPEFLNKRTAITAEQLDDIESMTKAGLAVHPDVTLQLVTIARAALTWSEARAAVRVFAEEMAEVTAITSDHHGRRGRLGEAVKNSALAVESALNGAP